MVIKFVGEQVKTPVSLFHKLMHGLTGSILHGDEGREEVKLDDTRGVSIRIDKRN